MKKSRKNNAQLKKIFLAASLLLGFLSVPSWSFQAALLYKVFTTPTALELMQPLIQEALKRELPKHHHHQQLNAKLKHAYRLTHGVNLPQGHLFHPLQKPQ